MLKVEVSFFSERLYKLKEQKKNGNLYATASVKKIQTSFSR